ncbi:MAG: zinc ribbon domain-containing protein [Caldilineaceae bacterium]
MPIYEYTCHACGETFDHLWTSIAAAEKAAAAGTALTCPACQSDDTARIVSQVAVLGELGGLTPSEQRLSTQAERMAAITPKEQIQQFQSNREQKRKANSS